MTVYGYFDGPTETDEFPIDSASAAIAVGDFLSVQSVGYFKRATDSEEVVGVAKQPCASPSADGGATISGYTNPNTRFRFAIGNGTLDVGDVYTKCDVYTGNSIDLADTTKGNVYIMGTLNLTESNPASGTGWAICKVKFVHADTA